MQVVMSYEWEPPALLTIYTYYLFPGQTLS